MPLQYPIKPVYSDWKLFTALPSDKSRDVAKSISVEKIRSKILKSVLDIAILNEMAQRNVVSVPSIIDVFSKKYAVVISPGTMYPVFKKLEGQGYISNLPNRLPQLYAITTDGEYVLKNVQQTMDELQLFLSNILTRCDV